MAKKVRILHATPYGAYPFRAKDPAINEVGKLIADAHGDVSSKAFRQIKNDGGPSAACMVGWFHGKTKRPQNATLEAAGRAMGFKRVWVAHRPNR